MTFLSKLQSTICLQVQRQQRHLRPSAGEAPGADPRPLRPRPRRRAAPLRHGRRREEEADEREGGRPGGGQRFRAQRHPLVEIALIFNDCNTQY